MIDSHQHFVRLAKHPEVEGYREAQLAGKDAGDDPPEISDAMAFASQRAKAVATHDGTVEKNAVWADLNNSLVLRACKLNQGRFAPVGRLGHHPTSPAGRIAKQMERWADEGFVAFNFDPDGTVGKWTNKHGDGSLRCQIGRWRALAKYSNWASPDEVLGAGNVFVDTCVYNHLNMKMLFDAVPLDNILFGSVCHGAFTGILNQRRWGR